MSESSPDSAEASFSGVWTTGNVKSGEPGGNGQNVGGLVGFFEANALQPEAPPIR